MKPKQKPPAAAYAPLVLEGLVRDVTDVGDSVVETERGIVLVSGGLPNERVRVRTEQVRAGVIRGSLLGVLEPSPDRVEAACRIASRCGGCPLMSLALPAQQRLKQRRVERAVAGLCEPETAVQLIAAGEALAYRRRARFAFRKLGSGLVVGYHTHGTRHIVDVEACPILTPGLAAALSALRAVVGPVLQGGGSIDLDGVDPERIYVSIQCDVTLPQEAYRAAERLASEAPIVGVQLSIGEGAPARFGQAVLAPTDRSQLQAPRHGFSQVNAAVNDQLAALVFSLSAPEGARVLELYAGHGNFTLGLAERAAALLAVEGDVAAAEACRQNLRAHGHKHARVLTADVRELTVRERYDVLVLDPPRGGCATLAGLAAQTKPQRLVYISCHMTTLQRDLRALHAAGYVADRVHALDMFPQTGHVEAVVRMTSVAN